MTNLTNVVQELRAERDRAAQEIRQLDAALTALSGASNGKQTSGQMSPAGRARIAAAQRARWAKLRARDGNGKVVTMPKKRTLSAAARRKIAAAQRARWAKAKAAKRR